MDILALLDELQAIAKNGLAYANNQWDRQRYERLLELAAIYYGQVLKLPPVQVRDRLAMEVGQITPKIGACAAIFNPVGDILLMLRTDDNRWCLPCGWVELNEAPSETAIRETFEETGLEVKPTQLVGVFDRPASRYTSLHNMIAVVYICEQVGGVLNPSREAKKVQFHKITDIDNWHPQHDIYAYAAFDAIRKG